MNDFSKKYFSALRPTKKGVLCLLGIFIFLPVLIDLLLIAFHTEVTGMFSLTVFLLKGCFSMLFLFFMYHLLYFLISLIWHEVTKKDDSQPRY